MKILLVANYLPDRQQSMLRFAEMLETGLTSLGHQVRTVQPEPLLGRNLKGTTASLHKWVGYADKFLLFIGALREAARWADLIHICDHSNAIYTHAIYGGQIPVVVTCHDLLAVRGALGEETDCPASGTGKLLQRLILQGLGRASLAVCDSSYTLSDLERLTGKTVPARVVLLGFNHDYRILDARETAARLCDLPGLTDGGPYLLHVGSNLRRKNKEAILRIFARIHRQWPGKLVFAGPPLSDGLRQQAVELHLLDRVVEVIDPDNRQLEALYNGAFVFLFPSRFEGFGWPPIEAQKCGCPVITSDRGPLPEVVADSAFVCPVEDEGAMATHILRLSDPGERRHWIERGLGNVERFKPERMAAEYAELYSEVLAQ